MTEHLIPNSLYNLTCQSIALRNGVRHHPSFPVPLHVGPYSVRRALPIRKQIATHWESISCCTWHCMEWLLTDRLSMSHKRRLTFEV